MTSTVKPSTAIYFPMVLILKFMECVSTKLDLDTAASGKGLLFRMIQCTYLRPYSHIMNTHGTSANCASTSLMLMYVMLLTTNDGQCKQR